MDSSRENPDKYVSASQMDEEQSIAYLLEEPSQEAAIQFENDCFAEEISVELLEHVEHDLMRRAWSGIPAIVPANRVSIDRWRCPQRTRSIFGQRRTTSARAVLSRSPAKSIRRIPVANGGWCIMITLGRSRSAASTSSSQRN